MKNARNKPIFVIATDDKGQKTSLRKKLFLNERLYI